MTRLKEVRAFPEHIPQWAGIPADLHQWLDRLLSYWIYATVRKPCVV